MNRLEELTKLASDCNEWLYDPKDEVALRVFDWGSHGIETYFDLKKGESLKSLIKKKLKKYVEKPY